MLLLFDYISILKLQKSGRNYNIFFILMQVPFGICIQILPLYGGLTRVLLQAGDKSEFNHLIDPIKLQTFHAYLFGIMKVFLIRFYDFRVFNPIVKTNTYGKIL